MPGQAEAAGIHKKKAAIASLEKLLDRDVIVEMAGGAHHEVKGRLKGFDSNMNVVLADAGQRSIGGAVRRLGALIVHGKNVVCVMPATLEAIENPFGE